jgi:chromosome segregation ATPase
MAIETSTWVQIYAGSATFIAAIGALITALKTNRKVNLSAEAKKKEAAEAAQVIVDAAGEQVRIIRDEAERAHRKLRDEQAESDKWKTHCLLLDDKMRSLTTRVEGAETCQTVMTQKIKVLENEKKSLTEQVAKLTEQVAALREENRRLKEERDAEKQVIA